MSDVVLIILASIVGIITLMGVGANDVANSQATAVGSGAIKLRAAYVIAGLCEFLGSSLMGSNVSSTLGDDFIDHKGVISDTDYAWGMLFSLISAAIWIFICTYIKMPVSTTHSIIGALVGFELIATDWQPKYLNDEILLKVVLAWFASPLLGLILAYFFMLALSKFWEDINAKLRTLSMPLLENEAEASHENYTEKNEENSIEMGDITENYKDKEKEMETQEGVADDMIPSNDTDSGRPPKKTTLIEDIKVVTSPKAVKFGILFGIVMTLIVLFIVCIILYFYLFALLLYIIISLMLFPFSLYLLFTYI